MMNAAAQDLTSALSSRLREAARLPRRQRTITLSCGRTIRWSKMKTDTLGYPYQTVTISRRRPWPIRLNLSHFVADSAAAPLIQRSAALSDELHTRLTGHAASIC